jgi:hypothetical protein
MTLSMQRSIIKHLLLTTASWVTFLAPSAYASIVYSDGSVGNSSFTINKTGEYKIDAYGGFGASTQGYPIYFFVLGRYTSGGAGAAIEGIFNLSAGEVLNIGVGAAGAYVGSGIGGGGGGSFVSHDGSALIVAGGGGGSNYLTGGGAGRSVSNGQSGIGGSGGSGAPAAYFASGSGGGGGGGGFNGNGENGTPGSGYAGGAGGAGFTALNGGTTGGGLAGGGGGGGGFDGGAGGNAYQGGGGGTSFNAGTHQTSAPDLNTGSQVIFVDTTPPGSQIGYGIYEFNPDFIRSGYVAIDAVPEPSSWSMMLTGFGMLGSAMRRKRVLRKA